MIRLALAAAVLAAVSGCTLLLPTQDLIKPCDSQDDCDDGFLCEDQACLPEDDGSGSN